MGERWQAVDEYIVGKLLGADDALATTLTNNEKQGLPPIDVSAPQGKMLLLLAQMAGARRILEIGTLGGYSTIRREQKYGRNSRIDFLLTEPGRPDAYVEVKNVHFMRKKGLAEFPDTATKRGAKHLEELGDAAEAGYRAVMLYLIQRDDCNRMRICDDLDPVYALAFQRAMARGVEAYAVKCAVSPAQISVSGTVKMDEWRPAVL